LPVSRFAIILEHPRKKNLPTTPQM